MTRWWRSLLAGFAALLLVLPILPLILWSVARGWRFPDLLPQDWSGDAWAYALSGTAGLGPGLVVTAWIALCVTGLSALLGIPAGRALGLMRFRGRGLVEALILAPLVVPGIAVVFGLHSLFLLAGLANSVTGVIIAHLIPALPYMTLVMAGVFAAFDIRVEAQARSLGAGPVQVFRHVTWPGIRAGVIAGGLMCFLVSWSQYLLTLAIGGGKVMTLPLILFSHATAGRHDLTAALALVFVLPGLLVLGWTSRRITGRNAALAGAGL